MDSLAIPLFVKFFNLISFEFGLSKYGDVFLIWFIPDPAAIARGREAGGELSKMSGASEETIPSVGWHKWSWRRRRAVPMMRMISGSAVRSSY